MSDRHGVDTVVYKNKAGQPRERVMVAAFSLVKDFGAKQADVAKALGCSQATVANWVKEIGYKKQVFDLEADLRDAKKYVKELRHEIAGYIEHDPD